MQFQGAILLVPGQWICHKREENILVCKINPHFHLSIEKSTGARAGEKSIDEPWFGWKRLFWLTVHGHKASACKFIDDLVNIYGKYMILNAL